MPTALNESIGRRPRPIPSHSLLYISVFSAREYVLNHIDGDLGLLEYPIRIVVSERPHLVYEASFEDLLEPTEEVVIAFMYIAENGNNVFRSCTLPHGVFVNSFTASSNGWNFGWGSAPKVMHLCDCHRQ